MTNLDLQPAETQTCNTVQVQWIEWFEEPSFVVRIRHEPAESAPVETLLEKPGARRIFRYRLADGLARLWRRRWSQRAHC